MLSNRDSSRLGCIFLALAWFAFRSLSAEAASLTQQIGGCEHSRIERTVVGTPANYRTLLGTLQPGDRLLLESGTYDRGLALDQMDGEPTRCIFIEGPTLAPPAVFTGRSCCNTLSLRDVSYVVIRNLTLDGKGQAVDAVKAEAESSYAHHVTLENLHILGHGANQQVVGISTKSPAWNWVIRRNVIEEAGTGLYLGNSNGEEPFVNGLIEYNLVRNTIGYNMQVKHQNGRDTTIGYPSNGKTVIRYNVFSKAANGSTGGSARPNLLVGHWPLSGPGASDRYLIYGNVFHQNPNEALFQGEGNIALYTNLFWNDDGAAVHIQPHNDVPRDIHVFRNTVVASTTGIRVSGGHPSFQQEVLENAVFAATPFSGGNQIGNVGDTATSAPSYLVNPFGTLDGESARADFFPRPGMLIGPLENTAHLTEFLDAARDFNGNPRNGTRRGAYGGGGHNPGWRLELDRRIAIRAQDELAVDFGSHGLWHHDGTSWSSWTRWDPEQVIPFGHRVAAAFSAGRGLWLRDATEWRQITPWSPYEMLELDSHLVAAFDDGRGTWLYDGVDWKQIAGLEPTTMTAWRGSVILTFPGRGLWRFDAGAWTQLTNWEPTRVASWRDTLVATFDNGRGLWRYSGSGWQQMTSWEADALVPWGTRFIASFVGRGVWSLDSEGWSRLTGLSSQGITPWYGQLVVDFDARGLWSFDGSLWTRTTNWNPSHVQPWFGGVAVAFTDGRGLWFRAAGSWSEVTRWDVEGIAHADVEAPTP